MKNVEMLETFFGNGKDFPLLYQLGFDVCYSCKAGNIAVDVCWRMSLVC